MTNWYVLRSKPCKEETVWRQAQSLDFETFYPRLRVRPVNPRSRKVRPYFPGYLFVQADLDVVGLSTFQYMPYAIGLVCFGGEPAYVQESLILAIRGRVEEIAEVGGELFEIWDSRVEPVAEGRTFQIQVIGLVATQFLLCRVCYVAHTNSSRQILNQTWFQPLAVSCQPSACS